ncbi:non-canonical purine NTP pyrophosphatase [Bombiscardovia coagulans]|uniref:dITP/XTP pyrophosphatase n=1 Tax=Bombiscardovia coagulans TaxID=686666 RepID=A0A261EVI0_9BIFI|nr:non-canonical purine NTP pyrophosphatase [Bombiscardovia coagulans]OZG50656.1 Ham1 family protein [Bombiscardovia coagulans]
MVQEGRRVVVATHNEGKLVEMQAILQKCLAVLTEEQHRKVGELQLMSAGQLGLPDPVENGVTFEENALIKARDVAHRTGLPALADDSGLVVDVMGAAPGIFSARWAGKHGDDGANIRLLSAQLKDLPEDQLGARFVTAAALVLPASNGDLEFVRPGTMTGHLIHEARGRNGFGYDPIFVPDEQPDRAVRNGLPITSAEMTAEEKNAISHRGKALRAIMPVLVENLL